MEFRLGNSSLNSSLGNFSLENSLWNFSFEFKFMEFRLGILDWNSNLGILFRNSRIPKLAQSFGVCASAVKTKAPRFLSYFLRSQRSTSRGVS